MLFAGGFITLKEVLGSNPLINEDELKVIEKLQNTEENAFTRGFCQDFQMVCAVQQNISIVAKRSS